MASTCWPQIEHTRPPPGGTVAGTHSAGAGAAGAGAAGAGVAGAGARAAVTVYSWLAARLDRLGLLGAASRRPPTTNRASITMERTASTASGTITSSKRIAVTKAAEILAPRSFGTAG